VRIVYFARGVARTVESAGRLDDAVGVDAGWIVGWLLSTAAGRVVGRTVLAELWTAGLAAAAESARATAARRADGNSIGVTTMTSAMSASARRVRLSMQRREVARELDHTRPDETDCIARCDVLQASLRETRRGVRSLRSHRRSSLDNSGTRGAGAARESLGSREQVGREAFAWLGLRTRRGWGDALVDGVYVGLKRVHCRLICFVTSSDGDIHRSCVSQHREQPQSHELAQAPLEAIPIDGTVLVPRHYDAYTRKRERGSEDPHIEMRGPNSLPLANYGLDVRAPRQPIATRKSKAVVRRLRTCSGV
jgi:hypothetical protein